jgi:cytoskeletal protein CcmA (bactofilin family)
MADLRIKTIDESDLDTVLAEDIEFEGTIEFSDPLLIKGSAKGEIRSESDLFIAGSATVAADVHARRITVKGSVEGDVDASERVELFSGATIRGNVKTPDLIVQSGSRLSGRCEMPDQPGPENGTPARPTRGTGT